MSRARSAATKRAPSAAVDAFIAALEHPHADAVVALREAIRAADPRIGEGIRWNAPSFSLGDDFATMNLRRKRGIALILHFGAKKSAISETGVDIADPQGLLEWLARDRAIVEFLDARDVAKKRAALGAIVRAWIAHLP